MEERTPAIRASDAERDATMTRLRDAAVEGRLTFEELADRLDAAAGAKTRQELERLTEDLPAASTPATPAAAAPARTVSVFGDVRRKGAWIVPADSRWQTVFGDVVLDLREARVSAPVIRIEARTFFGEVDLLVPEGVAVDVYSRTLFGEVKQQAGGEAPPGAPRIVLSGGTVFGDVRVRAKRLRERLAERLGWRVS